MTRRQVREFRATVVKKHQGLEVMFEEASIFTNESVILAELNALDKLIDALTLFELGFKSTSGCLDDEALSFEARKLT